MTAFRPVRVPRPFTAGIGAPCMEKRVKEASDAG
jgi:hypothetical protein